jgi:hypothetical protein
MFKDFGAHVERVSRRLKEASLAAAVETAENSRPLEQRRTSGGNGGGTAAHGPLRMSQPRGPQSQMPKPPGADLPPLAAQGCRDLWDNLRLPTNRRGTAPIGGVPRSILLRSKEHDATMLCGA